MWTGKSVQFARTMGRMRRAVEQRRCGARERAQYFLGGTEIKKPGISRLAIARLVQPRLEVNLRGELDNAWATGASGSKGCCGLTPVGVLCDGERRKGSVSVVGGQRKVRVVVACQNVRM